MLIIYLELYDNTCLLSITHSGIFDVPHAYCPTQFECDYPNLSGFVPLPNSDGKKNPAFEIHPLSIVDE